jgi:hypothetical protein
MKVMSQTNLISPTMYCPAVGRQASGHGELRCLRRAAALLALALLALDVTAGRAQQAPLQLQNNTGLPAIDASPGHPAAGFADYDNDGKLDLLVQNLSGSVTNQSLFRNNGNGTFSPVPTPSLWGYGNLPVSWVDVDNDGNLDFVYGERLFHNEGNGTFTVVPNFQLPNPGGIAENCDVLAWTDFDHDGRQDFFYVTNYHTLGTNSYSVQLYRNLGTNTFQPVWGASLGVPLTIACADMDNDGWEDLVLSDENSFIEIWHNNRGDPLRPPFSLVSSNAVPAAAVFSIFDYDNDGLLDIAVSDGNGGLILLHNLGNNAFQQLTASTGGSVGFALFAGDFDNDGRTDLLAAGGIDTFALLHNVGGGNFTTQPIALTNLLFQDWPVRATLGDYNNDGRLDVYLDFYGETNLLFLNTTAVSNTPPTAPTGLAAVPYTNAVSLTWNAASDAQTPSAGLSYALRVGTAPGLADVVNPSANLVTGWRRLPRRGPIQTTFYTLTNLPPGVYYWSVQAIDTGLAGGPFAAESVFAIPGLGMRPPYAFNVTSNSAILRGWGLPGGAPASAYFEWGTNVDFGNQTGLQSLGSGTNFVPFQAILTGLQPNQLYYFRAFVVNGSFQQASTRNTFYTDSTIVIGDTNWDGRIDSNEAGAILSSYFSGASVVLTNPAVLGGGAFQFGLGDLPTWPFQVQASSDLLTWSNLPPNGRTIYQFIDPAGTNSPPRYYRLR